MLDDYSLLSTQSECFLKDTVHNYLLIVEISPEDPGVIINYSVHIVKVELYKWSRSYLFKSY